LGFPERKRKIYMNKERRKEKVISFFNN